MGITKLQVYLLPPCSSTFFLELCISKKNTLIAMIVSRDSIRSYKPTMGTTKLQVYLLPPFSSIFFLDLCISTTNTLIAMIASRDSTCPINQPWVLLNNMCTSTFLFYILPRPVYQPDDHTDCFDSQ